MNNPERIHTSNKTDMLEAHGIHVAIGHSAENVRGADVLVFSAAISPENPERAAARAAGIPEIERCDLLGQLMRGNRFAVGDVVLGKVRKIMPGLNAAFVDLNDEKDGFLHYLDLGP